MTLRVVCGEGHVNEYNLTIEPTQCFRGSKQGGEPMIWNWEYWECREPGCQHKDYVSHVVDDKFYVHASEDDDGSSHKRRGAMMAFMLLALFLSRKAVGGM